MEGVYIGWADESDHTLGAFSIPANDGDKAPGRITPKLFRSAMRGTLYPDAALTVEPFRKTSDWWKRVTFVDPSVPDDPEALERVAKWGRLFDWFRNHPELRAPAYVGVQEPTTGAFASVYPKWFLALTAAGSLVGLATCVVWT